MIADMALIWTARLCSIVVATSRMISTKAAIDQIEAPRGNKEMS